MSLFALGISHHTAPLDVRERATFAPDTIDVALTSVKALPGVDEAVLLSTCNRTEIYCATRTDDANTNAAIEQWFLDARGHLDLKNFLYQYHDDDVVRHLLRVCGGLDSMVLGEPQILGQAKHAYELAMTHHTIATVMHQLFQHAFSVAKQIRSDTAIGENPVSIAYAATDLAHRIFADFGSLTTLLVGAGETIELTARHLHKQGIGRMLIANRRIAKARALAEEFDAQPIHLSQLGRHLHEADIIISATGSPQALIERPAIERAITHRRHRPIFMADLAVPRDIDPTIAQLADVYLYTVDDLGEYVEAGIKSRQSAARQAQDIVDAQVERFAHQQRTLDAVPTIRALRETANDARARTLDHARHMLESGHDPQQALDYLAHTLTNRLLHAPTKQLRAAGEEGRSDTIEAARILFDIDH